MVPGARRGIRLAVVACTALLAISLSSPAAAHKKRQIGEVRIAVGWLEEPPLAGFQNGVQILATRGGEPVEGGTLRVVVLFGGRNSQVRTEPMPLTPVFGEPGHYLAHLIPTRPGQYTFLITGRL